MESFRPLFGDLSSIPQSKTFKRSLLEFPSPLRGLIFHSKSKNLITPESSFPSPLRGLIFHSKDKQATLWKIAVSVPSSGTYLPFPATFPSKSDKDQVSVPSSGTYLPFFMLRQCIFLCGQFPSPLRGLIFHSPPSIYK